MTLLGASEKNKLRADGHKSQFYLSVCKPAVLLTAQVNAGDLFRGSIAIPFDAGSGPITRIRPGQTVKTVIDGVPYEQRVKDFTSSGSSPNFVGTVTIDDNNIPWTDNVPITVYELFEPRIIQPTFDPLTGVSTKRGLLFSADKTLNPGPIAVLGIHRAGFLENGEIVFDLDGAGIPVDDEAEITSYLWECTGGSIANPNIAATTVTFDTPGQYWLFLTVTDTGLKSHTGMRHIWVHSSDPEDPDYPYTDFSPPNISISLEGGMRTALTVFGVADQAEFVDNALVVLWSEDWYGDSKGAISLIPHDYGVLFTGYIAKDTIQYDSEHGTVTFEAASIIDVMKMLPMQALSIHAEAESMVTYWFQTGPTMTMLRLLYWLLYWHSTLLDVADWSFPDTELYKKLFKFNEGGLYNQVRDITAKVPAVVACNKAGQIFVKESIHHLDEADRAAVDIVSEITSADWREAVVIIRKARKDTAMVYLSGFFYDGGSQITPYCSLAPTKIREGQGGGKMGIEGMILEDQDHANMLSGRYHAIANSEYEEVRIKFSGNYSVIDVMPQRWWTLTLTEEETPRGITLTDRRLLPRSINLQLDPESGVLLCDAVFEPEAFGPDGVDTLCPSDGATVRSTKLIGWPDGGGPDGPGPPALLSFSSVKRLDQSAETWETIDDVVAQNGDIDPFWPTKANSVNPEAAIIWLPTEGELYKIVQGTPLTNRAPVNSPPNIFGDLPAPLARNLTYLQSGHSRFVQNRHWVLAAHQNSSDAWRGWAAVTGDDGVTWTWAGLYDGHSLPAEIWPLWMAANQDYVLVTVWQTPGKLNLLVFDQELAFIEEYDLGDATKEEVQEQVYHAFPVTVIDDPDLWYIAGRMQAPQALSDPCQIIVTDDAGASFAEFVADWGASRCAALEVSQAQSGERTFYAVRQGGA